MLKPLNLCYVFLLCNVFLIECLRYMLLMRLCDTWMEKWICGDDLSPCMEETCASMIDRIELRWWLYDIIMHCERMMISESLIVLFMFAYQILMNIEMRATPGRGLMQMKKKIWLRFQQKRKRMCGQDSGKTKWKGLGLQQIYGVANFISKYERGENLGLQGYLHG